MSGQFAQLRRSCDRALAAIRSITRGSAAVVVIVLAAQLMIPAIRVAHEIDHVRAHEAVLASGATNPRASCGHPGHACRPAAPSNADTDDQPKRPAAPADKGSCGVCVVLAIVRTAVVPVGPELVALAQTPVETIRPAAQRVLVRQSSRPPPARGPPVIS